MGFFDSLWDSTVGNVIGWITEPINAAMDSLGLTQHGRDQYFNRETQREFLAAQQNFEREQTANQQAFTRAMFQRQLDNYPWLLKKQADMDFNLWSKQFAMQNDYNSPISQVQRLLGAGINPNSVFGGSGQVATSQMSPSNLSTPQINPTPFMSPASPVGLPSGFSMPERSIAEVGSFLRDMAHAKKMGVETDQLEKLFDLEVQERSTRIFGQKLTNQAISIQNYVNDNIKDTRVRLAAQDLLKLVAETKNIDEDTGLKLASKFKVQSEELLNLSKKRLNEEDFELLKFKVDNMQEEFDTTMANLRSQTQANKAQAALDSALAKTENALRQGRVDAQTLSNDILSLQREMTANDTFVSNKTTLAKVDGIINQLKREGFLTKEAEEHWKQAQIETSWTNEKERAAVITSYIGAVGNVLGGVAGLASGTAALKGVAISKMTMQQRNNIKQELGREFNDIYRQSVSKQRDYGSNPPPIVGFGRQ